MAGGEPGRTPGDDSEIQRGRLNPNHQLFGQVTSRTHQPRLYDDSTSRLTNTEAPKGRCFCCDSVPPLAASVSIDADNLFAHAMSATDYLPLDLADTCFRQMMGDRLQPKNVSRSGR